MEQLSENASDEGGLRPLPKFAVPISERSEHFRERYFPEATRADWNDWRWQLSHRLNSVEEIERVLPLTDSEKIDALTTQAKARALRLPPDRTVVMGSQIDV